MENIKELAEGKCLILDGDGDGGVGVGGGYWDQELWKEDNNNCMLVEELSGKLDKDSRPGHWE